jgi:HEAT repeat protein
MSRVLKWLCLAILAGVGIIFLFPSIRLNVIGYVKHERLYRGHPTSYWAQALKDKGSGSYDETVTLLKDGGADGVPMLIEAMESDDPTVRLRSSEALGEIGADAIPAVITALQSDDRIVRITAARSLNKMGAAAKSAIPAMIQALDDQEFLVKQMIIRALAQLGPDAHDAIPPLIAMVQGHQNPAQATSLAADALAEIGPNDERVRKFFTEALNSPDEDIQDLAAKKLKDMKAKKAPASEKKAATP